MQKPEGEGFHTYIVNKDLTTEEVDVVPAGMPFIYVSPTNDGEGKRLLIPQDDQEYVGVPNTETLLSGMYLQTAVDEAFVFGTETETNIEGEDEDAQYVTVTNAVFAKNENWGGSTNSAYIAADAVENVAKFKFVDGNLVAIDEDGQEIVTGVTEVSVVRVQSDAIYNLNGMRVENPTKGLYIRDGKKFVVK